MAHEVTLPQLGESVTEGTITAWLKEVGDTIEVDEPLFELSSDKIDTEVPAPAAGVLKEIKVDVDETVDVGTVVAIIGDEGEAGGEAPEAAEEEAAKEEPAEAEEAAAPATEEQAPAPAEEGDEEQAPAPAAEEGHKEEGTPELASPLVRRLAEENDIDLSSVQGSGQGGRVTREDVEQAISGDGGKKAAKPSKESAKTPQPQRRPDTGAEDGRSRTEDLSRIRQRIAAKMMESMQSTAQLTTVQEADVSGIMRARAAGKESFKKREGVSLSPFVFLCRAAILALRNHPKLSAQADWDGGTVTFHDYVNLGIAVDTEKGLIVPNVKGADDLSIAGLARGIAEAADKARGKGKLEITDIEGATFTMTNTGSVGVLIDTPILNYPEVAILGTGAIKKRPVVIEDDEGSAIAVRDMMYLSLTYDHRLIDGADAARFVTEVKDIIESHDWTAELGL